MGSYSIGEALNLLLEKSRWKPKVVELRLRQEWEQITGKTIAQRRFTSDQELRDVLRAAPDRVLRGIVS